MLRIILKNKLYGFFLLTLFLFSCSAKKDYEVTSAFLNDLKKPFSNQDIDTLEIVNYSSILPKSVLESYLERKTEKITCADCQKIVWVNPNYNWILEENEIYFMFDELKKNEKLEWKSSKLKTKITKIKIVEYPQFQDNYNKDIEVQRLIKNERYIALISKPIFNKKKNIALISCDMILLPGFGRTKIYVKEDNKWVLAATFEIQ
jgi:hypothetical protein